MDQFLDIFDYPAHAFCLSYDWRILAPDIAFNIGIAFAYFCIPMMLFRLMLAFRQSFLPFRSVIWMFVVFIMACGCSHITRVLSMLFGNAFYVIDIMTCGVTFIASLITTFVLIRNGRDLLTLLKSLIMDEIV
jgi:hypothetical protein